MTNWFEAARFGMFVHWGHSSQRGIELSWPLVGGRLDFATSSIAVSDYHATASTFNPDRWDARALARRAKRLGMEYAVFTTKHHDGYSMFHTKASSFSVEHSPYRKDIVREFVDSMRAERLRIGFYYSLSDWHHPDYPAFTEADKPYRLGRWPRAEPDKWARYQEFLFTQVRELLTNYGQIDLIWFDGQWERSVDQWKALELAAMIRSLQPGIVINDRLPGQGDFDTPEQFAPAQPPARPWEVCMTMNESWGYNIEDTNWKPARQLIHTLCEIAAKGGRLLLNVGPKGDGSLPVEISDRLDAFESWIAKNAESIIGTTPGLDAWQWYGPSTRRGDAIYLHLLMRPYETVTVRGVPIKRVRSVRSLSDGRALQFSTRSAIIDNLLNARDPTGELTITVPEEALDPFATVLVLEVSSA